MSKIISDPDILDRVKKAKAGDVSVYINYEAIKELPEEFDVQISKVKFDIKTDFSKVTKQEPITYMPTPALMYKVAEAKGISGNDNKIVSPLYENVNINEMFRKEEFKMMNTLVGYTCTKQSSVLNEDGTVRVSSPCTIDYNAWNRCLELWTKEESYSDGYKKQGKYDFKYDTQFKRKAHFYYELKFAMQKAETKAFEKTIREMAGLMTGYTADDLKEGAWYFARVRRSSKIMKLETAARLTALENGNGENKPATRLLFGPEPTEPAKTEQQQEPEERKIGKDISDVEIIPEEPEKTDPEKMSAVLKKYLSDEEIRKNIQGIDKVNLLIEWLDGKPNINEGTDSSLWKKAIRKLQEIEGGMHEFMREEHGLYKEKT
jgi:hypothetical protein